MAPGERISKLAEQAVVEDGVPRAQLANLDARLEASIPDDLPVGWASRQDAAETRSQRYDYFIHRFLVVADVSALLIAALITVLLADIVGRPSMAWTWWAAIGITLPAWILIVHGAGLYRMMERRFDVDLVDEVSPVVISVTAWIWLMVVARTVLFPGEWQLFMPLCMWLFLVLTTLLFRSLARAVARTRDWYRRSVAVVGRRLEADLVAARMERHPEWGLDPKVEFILGESVDGGFAVAEVGEEKDDFSFVESGPRRLAARIASLEIDRVVIAGGFPELGIKTELIRELVERRIGADVISGGVETLYSTAVVHHMEGLSALGFRPSTARPVASRLKRLIDITISGASLIALSPILLWAAIRIKTDTRGPVFYRQSRVGLDGERFEVLKLRTMVDGAHDMHGDLRDQTLDEGNDDVMFKLPDDPRITDAGRVLRKWSLDELPQLWNVLKGDMSMVGPRPLIPEEAAMVTDHFMARELVRPGIAGPWQFLGRSNIPFDDMVRLDYAYVASWSVAEDLRLLARTFIAVLRRNGAY